MSLYVPGKSLHVLPTCVLVLLLSVPYTTHGIGLHTTDADETASPPGVDAVKEMKDGSMTTTSRGGMLRAVQNPFVATVSSDQGQFALITANVTIGFTTGPNLKSYEYSAKCVPQPTSSSDISMSCAEKWSGDGAVFGFLPARSAPEIVYTTVTGLNVTDPDASFSCYVSVYLDTPYRKVSTCFPVQTPGRPDACVEDELSATTDWALGCGITNCTAVCASFGKSCTVNGMRRVDTEQKGAYVLNLFDLPITESYENEFSDSPVVDYYSPFRSEFYWNGIISDCDQDGLEPVSRRLCCCGPNCPTST